MKVNCCLPTGVLFARAFISFTVITGVASLAVAGVPEWDRVVGKACGGVLARLRHGTWIRGYVALRTEEITRTLIEVLKCGCCCCCCCDGQV